MNWKKMIKGCFRIACTALAFSLEVGCSENKKSVYNATEAHDLFEKGEIGYQEFAKATKRCN